MADLNEILYGQAGGNAQLGAPQVPPGVLQQAAAAPVVPPAQFLPAGPIQQNASYPPQGQAAAPAEDTNSFASLVQKVQSDPALSQAAMMMGIRLAQGARPGQNTLGLLGDTAMMGVSAYQMLEGNKRTQGMQDEAFQNKQAEVRANTQGQQLQNTEAAAVLPAMIKAKIAKAGMLERAGKVDEAESVVAQARADFRKTLATNPNPGTFETAWRAEIQNSALSDNLKMQLTQAQIAGAYASAGAAGASAENALAHAGLARAQTETPERFRNQPQSAVNAQWQEMRDSLKQTNPEATPQQIEALVQDAMVKRPMEEKIFAARNKLAESIIAQTINPTEAQVQAAYATAAKQFPSAAGGPSAASGSRQASGAIVSDKPATTGTKAKVFNDADIAAMIARYPEKKLTRQKILDDAAAMGAVYQP